MQQPPPPLHFDVDKIDERWLRDWISFGMRELRAYLINHAAFDQYLIDHNLKEH